MRKQLLGVCTLLPLDARMALVNAAHTDPKVRDRAVDAAIDRVKLCYPQFFKHPEPEVEHGEV